MTGCWFGVAELQAIMDHEVPHYYLASQHHSHLILTKTKCYRCGFGVCFLTFLCTDTCLSVHKAHNSADNYFGFSVMLPFCTYRYKLFTQLNMFSQCCEKVGIL